MSKKGSLKEVAKGNIVKIEGVKVPEPIAISIDKFSKQTGKPLGLLVDKLVDFYKYDVSNHKRSVDYNHWSKALGKLRIELRKEDGSITDMGTAFTSFVAGDSGVKDFVELRRKKAKAIFETNPKEAEKQGLTDASGNVLDYRKTIDFEDNTNYLMPFREDDHDYSRELYGWARYTAEGDYKFFKLNLRRQELEALIRDPNLPVQRWVDFKANERTSSPTFEMNAGVSTKFTTSAEDVDLDEIIGKTDGMEVYSLTDLDTVKDMVDEYQVFLIKALVYSINPEVNDYGNRTIILDDIELGMGERGVAIFMPEHIPLDFSEATEVIFLATIGENRGKIVLNGVGYYVSPDLKD